MPDKKLPDSEIIKALECCAEDRCSQCPLQDDVCSEKDVIKNALDLITRQQAEIEQWKEEANRYQNLWCIAANDISKAKSEAVKEFAERLKTEIDIRPTHSKKQNEYVFFLIDNLLKEMVGEDE